MNDDEQMLLSYIIKMDFARFLAGNSQMTDHFILAITVGLYEFINN